MITIAVCDDNCLFLEQAVQAIERILKQSSIFFSISKFTAGSQLLEAGFFDLVFLDIEMEGMDGLETARRIRQRKDLCSLIFVTSHPEYVFSAFDVGAYHYLLKPLDQDKLETILLRRVRQEQEGQELSCTIRQGSGYCRMEYSKIHYVEVMGRKLFLHTTDGTVAFNGRLEDFRKELPACFFSCHRSYMVNLSWVQGYDNGEIYLPDGERIPIARRRISEFKKEFLHYLCRKEG